MDFGATISRALKITWQHKTLWLIMLIPIIGSLVALVPFFVVFFGAMAAGIATGIASEDGLTASGMMGAGILGAYCLLFVGYIFILVLALVSQGALIEGVRQAEDEGRVQFGNAMRVGWRNAGKLFVSGLVISLPVFGILCIGFAGVMAVALSAGGAGLNANRGEDAFAAIFSGGLCAVLGLYCAILGYALFASGIYVMSERAIVLDNTDAMESLRRGWRLFRANLGSIFLLAIVLVGVQFIVSIVLQFGLQFSMFPLMNQFSQLGSGARPEDLSRVFSGLFTASFGLVVVILYILIMIWSVLYSVFNSAAWTLAYRQFVNKGLNNINSTPPAPPSIPELR